MFAIMRNDPSSLFLEATASDLNGSRILNRLQGFISLLFTHDTRPGNKIGMSVPTGRIQAYEHPTLHPQNSMRPPVNVETRYRELVDQMRAYGPLRKVRKKTLPSSGTEQEVNKLSNYSTRFNFVRTFYNIIQDGSLRVYEKKIIGCPPSGFCSFPSDGEAVWDDMMTFFLGNSRATKERYLIPFDSSLGLTFPSAARAFLRFLCNRLPHRVFPSMASLEVELVWMCEGGLEDLSNLRTTTKFAMDL